MLALIIWIIIDEKCHFLWVPIDSISMETIGQIFTMFTPTTTSVTMVITARYGSIVNCGFTFCRFLATTFVNVDFAGSRPTTIDLMVD